MQVDKFAILKYIEEFLTLIFFTAFSSTILSFTKPNSTPWDDTNYIYLWVGSVCLAQALVLLRATFNLIHLKGAGIPIIVGALISFNAWVMYENDLRFLGLITFSVSMAISVVCGLMLTFLSSKRGYLGTALIAVTCSAVILFFSQKVLAETVEVNLSTIELGICQGLAEEAKSQGRVPDDIAKEMQKINVAFWTLTGTDKIAADAEMKVTKMQYSDNPYVLERFTNFCITSNLF